MCIFYMDLIIKTYFINKKIQKILKIIPIFEIYLNNIDFFYQINKQFFFVYKFVKKIFKFLIDMIFTINNIIKNIIKYRTLIFLIYYILYE